MNIKLIKEYSYRLFFKLIPYKYWCLFGRHSWWFNCGWYDVWNFEKGTIETTSYRDDHWTCSKCGKILDDQELKENK